MLQVLVQATDPGMYRVHSHHFLVPCLVPLLQYTFKVSGSVLKRSLGHSAAQHSMSSQTDAGLTAPHILSLLL